MQRLLIVEALTQLIHQGFAAQPHLHPATPEPHHTYATLASRDKHGASALQSWTCELRRRASSHMADMPIAKCGASAGVMRLLERVALRSSGSVAV